MIVKQVRSAYFGNRAVFGAFVCVDNIHQILVFLIKVLSIALLLLMLLFLQHLVSIAHAYLLVNQ